MKIITKSTWEFIKANHKHDILEKEIEIDKRDAEIARLKARLCYLDLIERIYGLQLEDKTIEEAARMFEEKSEYWPKIEAQFHKGFIRGADVVLLTFMNKGIISPAQYSRYKEAVIEGIEKGMKDAEESKNDLA